MSAPEPVDRIVVVAPSYQLARSELSELHPNSWCYVTRADGLQGRRAGTRLLVLDAHRLSTSQLDVVEMARARGFEAITLSSVAPRAAARERGRS